jgi:hypothetical protein
VATAALSPADIAGHPSYLAPAAQCDCADGRRARYRYR